jgi:hypothetical protein
VGGLAPLKSLFPEIIQTIPVSKNSGETLTFSSNFVGESSIVFPAGQINVPNSQTSRNFGECQLVENGHFFLQPKLHLILRGKMHVQKVDKKTLMAWRTVTKKLGDTNMPRGQDIQIAPEDYDLDELHISCIITRKCRDKMVAKPELGTRLRADTEHCDSHVVCSSGCAPSDSHFGLTRRQRMNR